MSLPLGKWDYEVLAMPLTEIPEASAETMTFLADTLPYLTTSGGNFTLVYASRTEIQDLNRAHRDLDTPTDVLSFPPGDHYPPDMNEASNYLGDIVICYEIVSENSDSADIDPALELRHVVLHGVLHLLGYSHGSEEEADIMRMVEEKWLGSEIHGDLSE